MKFKFWLEQDEYEDLINVILPNVNVATALNMPIDSLKANDIKSKIEKLGIFKRLPFEEQQSVFDFLDSGRGSVKELVNKILGTTL